jgi:hypothetical protein
VALIHADLTAGDGETGMDLTLAQPIKENARVSFQGSQKIGAFDISGDLARQWLGLPNPNGKPNSLVLKLSWNGLDVTRRPRDGWIIDFGTNMGEADAALYEAPFEYVVKHVKPEREANNREGYQKYWWRHGEPRIAMRTAFTDLPRYMTLSAVTKHIFWRWLDKTTLPDKALIVVAHSDDTTFGILHSRFHELWSLGLCTWLGKGNDPRYTPTTCFETFPFPPGLTPKDTAPLTDAAAIVPDNLPHSPHSCGSEVSKMDKRERIHQRPVADALSLIHATTVLPRQDDPGIINDFSTPAPAIIADASRRPHAQAIAEAAFKLNQLRDNWLNPPEWVDWAITPEEEKAGFPKRPIAKAGHEADLKKRTLTNLYNTPPGWLIMAHKALDKAVANAYGWDDCTPDMPDAEILQRLLKLNLTH